MLEIECIEFLVVKIYSSKVRVETSRLEALCGIFDDDYDDYDEGSDKDSLMYTTLEKYMSSIDTDDTCQTKVYADYIFSDDKIFVYSRTFRSKHSGLMSAKDLEDYSANLSAMKAPEEILNWINALVAKSTEKNKIKLDLH